MKVIGSIGATADLDEEIRSEIVALAKEHDLEKVVLFGSRARGTNRPTSDIDLAAQGANVEDFFWDAQERVNTLLRFDVIDLDGRYSPEFTREIEKDGILLYEKTR